LPDCAESTILSAELDQAPAQRADLRRVVGELRGLEADRRVAGGQLGRDRRRGLGEVRDPVGGIEVAADAADDLEF
jgi:hypothetical protein